MINHFRTLLLNVDGSPPLLGVLGEEIVDPAYRAVALPSELRTLRAALFGATPDRTMLNWRAAQFLTLVHATPLAEYVTALDPRITYEATGLLAPTLEDLTPSARKMSTAGESLFLYGNPVAADPTGVAYHRLTVETIGTGVGRVTSVTPPMPMQTFSFTTADRLALPGTGYVFRLSSLVAGQTWEIEALTPPQRDLSEVAASAASLGEPVYLALFGADPQEPFKTFRNLWTRNPELPLRLGGLICALAYRTEALR